MPSLPGREAPGRAWQFFHWYGTRCSRLKAQTRLYSLRGNEVLSLRTCPRKGNRRWSEKVSREPRRCLSQFYVCQSDPQGAKRDADQGRTLKRRDSFRRFGCNGRRCTTCDGVPRSEWMGTRKGRKCQSG